DGRKFKVCYKDGDCHEVSDAEFNRIKADATKLGSVFKDNKIYNEVDGKLVETASYTRTSFDDLSDQANAVIFGNNQSVGLVQRLVPVQQVVEVGAHIAATVISGGTSLGVTGGITLGLGARAAGSTAVKVAPQASSAISSAISGFTKHGINSAISHDGLGVSTAAILNTLKNPIKVVIQSGGRVRVEGKDATVILNRAGKVITTWARSSAGTRVKP
ncbi:MAG: hypothetical protein ACRD8U_21235, partial [Pyrinomonadaceae bacterium]